MKYMVIEVSPRVSVLTEAVNSQIEKGWEPIGGVSVATSADYPYFYQAMILRENIKKSSKITKKV